MIKIKSIEELTNIINLGNPMRYNDKYIFSMEGLAKEIFEQNLKYKSDSYVLQVINKYWGNIPIIQIDNYEQIKERIYDIIYEGSYHALRDIGCKFTKQNFDKFIYSFIDTMTKDTLIENTVEEYDIKPIIKDIFKHLIGG